MYNTSHIENTVFKIRRLAKMLDDLIYEKAGVLRDEKKYITKEHFYEIPDEKLFSPLISGEIWSGEGTNCWIRGKFTVPKELDGKTLYIFPHIGAYEGMLWVNGVPYGNFASKIMIGAHGNHYCTMLKKSAKAGEVIDIAMEFYMGHYVMGTMPFDRQQKSDYTLSLASTDICTENETVFDTLTDLNILLDLYDTLPPSSYRRGDIIRGFIGMHKAVYYDFEAVSKEEFFASLNEVRSICESLLCKKNGDTTAYVGLIGHSHMDTAWLWEIKETVRKCARTYSNQMSIMDRYPNYKFIQSSSLHSDMIRRNYKELFEQIRQKVKEGRYEPNGGSWIECDCNLTGGEAMVRQFIWGQKFTKKYFDYKSDCFWLPDTFGYNAAIPQILKKCDIDYFLTTKMAWNETNKFPYDSFWWQGIDGSRVLCHLNKTHTAPTVKNLNELTHGTGADSVKLVHLTNKKLFSYGPGDGGGGPDEYMLRTAEKLEDTEGCPRTGYTTVSEFMRELESTSENLPLYAGELYLEFHRGTLTNQHEIKRNNRLGEICLHDLECVTVFDSVRGRKAAESEKITPLYGVLLINQFHDILPGTSIKEVHETSKEQMRNMIKDAKELISETVSGGMPTDGYITLVNTLSFDREETVYLNLGEELRIKGDYPCQKITDQGGNALIAVANVKLPAMSSVVLETERAPIVTRGGFEYSDRVLETELFRIEFNPDMTIKSYFDKEEEREVVGNSYPLNTLLIAEDVPARYDNWDINWDLEMKYKPCSNLIKSEVVSNGDVELRIRNEYKISEKSTLISDMVFHRGRKDIVFENKLDWNEEHRFMKVAFDVSVFSDFSREEIQFGHIKRPNNRNTSIEQAKFEVVNHKYTDLSEGNYGVAILNDCKYGISVYGSEIRLSLHKSGMRPDYTGDKGMHSFSYCFMPHSGGFGAKTVVQRAYAFNYKPLAVGANTEYKPLITLSKDNIIIETIKPCEESRKAFVIRAYEACGDFTHTELDVKIDGCKIFETNMLEENEILISSCEHAKLTFKPFEIKTLIVDYEA